MKRRLLSFAVLLMTVWGTQNMFAQLDVTSYIINADFSNGKIGWTDTNFNNPDKNPKVYEAYAGWGSLDVTSYCIKQDVPMPAGTYRLDAFGFFRYGENYSEAPEKSAAYLRVGENNVLVKTLASEVTGETAANNTDDASEAFKAGKYLNSIEFTLPEEQIVSIGFDGTFEVMKSWFIGGTFKLYAIDEVARKNSINKVKKELEDVVASYTLPQGFMKTVNEVYDKIDNMGGTDEELDEAGNLLLGKKTEALQMIEACKEYETYYEFCIGTKENSVEKVEGASTTFDRILTLTNMMKDNAANVDKMVELKEHLVAGYQEYVVKAVPNSGFSFDYTFFIEGVGNSTNGWVNDFTGFNKNYQYNGASNKNNEALGLIKPGYIEAWNDGTAFTGTLTYTKNNLPTGVYKLSAYTFKNDGATVNFKANDKTISLADAAGLYTQPILEGVEVTDGTLTFGLEMLGNANWIGITNVELSYVGMLDAETLKASLTEARTALQNALDAATEANTIGKAMKEEVVKLLSETGNVGGDPIALELACNKVIAMTNSLGEITEAYAEVAQQIQEALLIITNSVVDNTDDKTAMSDAHTKANKELEEALDVEVIKAIGDDLSDATNAFVLVAYPTNGTSFDYTFLMENPSFETGDLSPWMATQGYDTGVKPNTGDFSFSGADGNYLFNTWNGSAIDFNVAQTVTNLRDGLYRLSALVASDAGNVITLTAGKATADVTAIDKHTGVNISVDNVEVVNGELFVKASSKGWFKADNFRLEYMGKLLYTEVPEAITPAEGDIESIPLPVIITPSGKYSVINGVHDGDYVESLNCPAPYLQKKGSEERIEVASVAYGSGNDIELYFVDDDGVPLQAAVGEQYDLVIPEGLYSCPDNKEDWESYILSGPQNKEIRCEYTIVEHIVGPNFQAIGIDPNPENAIETVSTFTLAFDQPVTINTSEDAPAVYLMSRLSGQISATVSVVEGEGQENQILITLEREVVDAGMYMLVVPEKVVLNANGDWNASVENLTYTVVGKKVETTNYQPTGITPAEGEVTSLKSFVLQFQKETFAVTNVDSQEEAYLINKDTQEKVSATLDMGDEYNEIKIELTEEVTAKGSYTLVVPAMKIQQASDSWGNNVLDNAPELRYDFTVVEGQSIDAILAKRQRVDVYTVSGLLVKKAADREALKTLKKGLYIINGKGVLIK